jgi:hypothetical protein
LLFIATLSTDASNIRDGISSKRSSRSIPTNVRKEGPAFNLAMQMKLPPNGAMMAIQQAMKRVGHLSGVPNTEESPLS